jgi:hypothetical protein
MRNRNSAVKTLELSLWDFLPDRPPFPCPGCGARAGEWTAGGMRHKVLRRWSCLGACEECCADREVVAQLIRDEPPIDLEGCKFAPKTDGRVETMARRFAAGLSLFSPHDLVDVPDKIRRSFPDQIGAPGETGVERLGKRWRVRPWWRGRKWLCGTYDTKEDAIKAARKFWGAHPRDDRPPPIAWIPIDHSDKFVSIERQHVDLWHYQTGQGRKVLIAAFRTFAKKARKQKPIPLDRLWATLTTGISEALSTTAM